MIDTPRVADPLFAPPVSEWHRLSPRYAAVRRVQALSSCLLVWTPALLASWFVFETPWLTIALTGAALAWTGWRVWRAGRWVASWGWAERDADLCITQGLWNRRLLVVPFGRMQVVEVTAGPLLRWQGLAAVRLITAAAHTDAQIPGLAHADAVALRDRMIELSDARGAGL